MSQEENPKQAEMVRRALNAETVSELESLYDDWAETYDAYLDGLSYVAPKLAAALFDRQGVAKTAVILDIACGTGLVGAELAQLGYTNLHGIDLSEGMLAIAKQTGQYQTLAQADISQPFSHESNSFDATICIGTLAIHVNTDPLDEMIRIAKPSGTILISIRNPHYEPSGYKAHLHALAEQGAIQLLIETEMDYILDEGATAVFVAMRVL